MFILTGDYEYKSVEDIENFKQAYAEYLKYIEFNKSQFSNETYDLVISEWNDNPNNHKLLRNSLLDSFTLEEVEVLNGQKRERVINISLQLLGAYRDGISEIKYFNVSKYAVNSNTPNGNGDYYCGEFRINESNKNIIHEIEWRDSSRWLIECCDIDRMWLPGK